MRLLALPGDKRRVGSEVLCPPTGACLGHRRPTEGRDTARTSAGSQPTEKSASDFFN